jgi:hypothetical protein
MSTDFLRGVIVGALFVAVLAAAVIYAISWAPIRPPRLPRGRAGAA